MSDNIITNDMDEVIGYYSDLVAYYKSMINYQVSINQYEEAKDLLDQLAEIDQWTDNDGLLVLSMNNGMGFTCKQYQQPKGV